VAQVIVFLERSPRRPAAASASGRPVGAMRALARYFAGGPLSQGAALVRAAPERPLSPSARRGKRPARAPREAPVRYYPHLGILFGSATREGIAKLRAAPAVARVAGAPALSLIQPKKREPARPPTTLTWGLRAMKVDKLWKEGATGRGIRVGHLDTGVDGAHPALRGAIERFAEFDDLGALVRPTPRAYDTEDHGTHTAATIAGRPVEGRHVGVAPGASLASAIVVESGNVVARVLGGMDWAVAQEVRVLSLSLGFRGWWDDFLALTTLLRERNVLPVFAVGNEGPGTSRSPGNYAEALSVGAHDNQRRVAYFSSSQRFDRKRDAIVPDLVAPGVKVTSAKPGGGYQSMDGSSMATPHVAGLAALLMEARPGKTAAEIEAAIFASCRRADGMTEDRAHRGMPDAVRALAALG
jgi:subtilisin